MSVVSFSQKLVLEIKGLEDCSKKIKPQFELNNYKQVEKTIKEIQLSLNALGYLAANCDSISKDSLQPIAYFYLGNIFQWGNLSKGNTNPYLLGELGFKEKYFEGKNIDPIKISDLLQKIITHYENNGYPFAVSYLDSIEIKDDVFNAKIKTELNDRVLVDTIKILGSAQISVNYLENYLGIKKGDLYNEQTVRQIKRRISELPFLTELAPYEVIFTKEKASLNLYIDKKKASIFDGVLGFLPNDLIPGRILITGDIKLKLLNSFGKGELIDANFKKLQNQTQDLKLNFVYPYIFRTKLGIDARIDLYRKDTSYVNVNRNLGVQYLLSGGNYFKAFIKNKTSNLISTKAFENSVSLPDFADTQTNLYGIGLKFERLDYRFNPRKGYYFEAEFAVGTRKIRQNANLNPLAYEGLKLNSNEYNLDALIEFYIPISKRGTFKISDRTAYIYNEKLFENELYRFGGFQNLRGFDEQSIFASFYNILNVEARYLLEKNSYAYLFWNGAYYEKKLNNSFVADSPYGFGAGLSFETKAGIFSLSYALGKQFNNPIQLRSGKVHFGIISFF